MHALIVTVVHVPLDARIYHRQLAALRTAGWTVTYAAPWTACGTDPADLPDGLEAVDLPRAAGRQRAPAVRAARGVLMRQAPTADIVVLHDPELLLATVGLAGLPPVVWDVHEDVAASLGDRPWLPAAARPAARVLARLAERWAEQRLHLLLAEPSYVHRFRRPHPVIRNVPHVPDRVPPPGDDRVVYLGRVSAGRGGHELLALARRLAPAVRVEVIGPADPDIRPVLERAAAEGVLRWDGFVPNDRALQRVEGALAGLSLLHDLPNYRASMPTKVLEYLARGVPAVTTPLPAARDVVERNEAGTVVPFADVDAAVEAVERLRADPDGRAAMARRGRDAVRRGHDWAVEGRAFVAQLERWAADGAEG